MKKVILIFALLAVAISSYAPITVCTIDSHDWPRVFVPTTAPQVYFLQQTLQRMVALPCYKPHDHLTFCNTGCKDALDNRRGWFDGQYGGMLNDLSLNIAMIWPTTLELWTYSIKRDYQAVLRAISVNQVERVTLRKGYELAKIGEVVFGISVKYNHEFILYPDQRPWIEERGPTIASCGWVNVITDMSHLWQFGKRYKDKEIILIWLRRK